MILWQMVNLSSQVATFIKSALIASHYIETEAAGDYRDYWKISERLFYPSPVPLCQSPSFPDSKWAPLKQKEC